LAEGVTVAKAALTRGLLLIVVACAPLVAAGDDGRASVLDDLRLSEPIIGDAVVFGADLYLEDGATVGGDAIAVGGSVVVERGAVVDGHVVAVFGVADVASPAAVSGRVLSYSSLGTLASGAPGQPAPLSMNAPMRLLAAGGWLLVTTGLAFLFPIRLRYAAWAAEGLALRVPALGMLLGLTLVSTIVATLGLGPALGVPLVAAVTLIFFAAKAVGLAVLGCWLGGVVLRRWLGRYHPITVEVFVGVMVLLGARFLPILGELLWMLISLTALGAAVAVTGVSHDAAGAEA
jgi:hypothetical protein